MEFGQDVGTVFALGQGNKCHCQGQLGVNDFMFSGRSDNCTSSCGGDTGFICGGDAEMSVFFVERVEQRPYERRGCFFGGDIMVNSSLTSDDMTPKVGIVKCLGLVACFADTLQMSLTFPHALSVCFTDLEY